MAIKYFIYARKSTEDRDKQIQSIEDQLNELRKIAQQRNLVVVDELVESRSAKAPGRPVFNKMLERIEKGEASGILTYQLNRLSRNPVDGGTISWWLQQSIIQSIQTFEKEYKPSDNVLMMAVELGMANQFLRDMVPAVRRGMQSKRDKGIYPHCAPPGYLNDTTKYKGERDIIPDPDRFDLIKKMLELVDSKLRTPMEVLRMANNEWGLTTYRRRKTGGGPMSSSTWYRVLTNPFYYGLCEEGGHSYKGIHKPMITEEQYWNIQKILGAKGRKRPRTKNFPYTGLIKCGECGYMITAEEKAKINKKTGKNFIYYRCGKKKPNYRCSQGAEEVFLLEGDVDEFLATITMDEEVKDWCIKYLKETNKEEVTINTQALASLNRQKEENQQKLYNLNTALIENRIVGNEYDQRKQQLLKEQEELTHRVEQVDQRTINWLENCEKTFNFCMYARYWFNHGTIEDKKVILSAIGLNLILLNKKLHIEPEIVFEDVQSGLKNHDWRA